MTCEFRALNPARRAATAALAALVMVAVPIAARAEAAAGEVNLYSSRHYDTDQALYQGFTAATGLAVNLIEGKADALIERISAEGERSPADVLITVDAGRLWRAEQAGLFRPVASPQLDARIPAHLRDPAGRWFGFSKRARVIVVRRDTPADARPLTYEALADPRWAGQVCVRSSSNIYQLSLMASLIHHLGLETAEAWARGVVANFARPPKGNDTAQLRAVASGECGIALANTYYVGRLRGATDPADRAVGAALDIVFPNQPGPDGAGRGTHVNISGAGVLVSAPNPAGAVAFLEYLASDQAQTLFAAGNNEYPVVDGVTATGPITDFGAFAEDPVNAAVFGENQAAALRAYDRAGWR